MIGVTAPQSDASRPGWLKFRIAQALGPGEHRVVVVSPGPPIPVVVNGPDYDERDRPSADIEAYYPDIDGISWADIWQSLRSRPEYPEPISLGVGLFGSGFWAMIL